MHYNFPRTLSAALLLIAMTMFCLQAKADFTPASNINPTKVYNTYALYDNGTATASFDALISQIASDLSINMNSSSDYWNFFNNHYLRWFVQDKNGNYTPVSDLSTNWTITLGESDGYSAGAYGKAWYNNGYNYNAKLASATFVSSKDITTSSFQLVCLFSKTAPTLNNNELTSDPSSFDAAIVFDMLTEEDLEKMFKEGSVLKTITTTQIVNSWGNQTVNMANTVTSELQKIFTSDSDNLYIRVYRADNGSYEKTDLTEFSSYPSSYYDKTNKGLVVNSSAKTSNKLYNYTFQSGQVQALLNNFTVNIPQSSETSSYSLVCLISKNSETRMGDYLLSEPDIDLKLIIEFKTVDEVKNLFTPSTTIAKEVESKILVTDFTKEQTLNLYTLFGESIKSALDYENRTNSNSYIRLVLKDKDGKIVNGDDCYVKPKADIVSNFTLSANGYITNSNVKTNCPFYYSYNNSYAGDYIKKLLDGLTVKIPDNTYTVECYLSNKDEVRAISSDGQISDYVLTEPDIDLKMTINFLSKDDTDNFTPYNTLPKSSTFETTYIIDKGAESATINLYRQHYQQVRSTLTDEQDWTGIKYLHWYFRNKETKEPLTTMVKGTFVPSTARTDITTVDNTKGYFMYNESGITNVQAANYKFTLNKTCDTSWDWSKVQAVCVISDDDEGADILTSDGTTYVKDEPTNLKYALIVNFQNSDTYTQDFKHYKGYAYKDVESKTETWAAPSPDNYQDVHVWEYNKYVLPGDTKGILLDLPIDQRSGGNQSLEFCGYYRWYDYKTDLWSDYLTTSGSDLKEIKSGDKSFGYFAFDKDKATYDMSQATFKAPSTGWESSDIACDVSRYLDGLDESRKYLFHEPTLSIRFLFHIYPATTIADLLKNTIIKTCGESIYEDYGYVTLGLTSKGKGTANLRVNLQDVGDYYFYAYSKVNKAFSTSEFEELSDEKKQALFGTELINAKSIKWYAYDPTGQYYKEITTVLEQGRMCPFTFTDINNTEFTSMENSQLKKTFSFNYGDVINVIAYACSETKYKGNDAYSDMCPIAIFRCIPVEGSNPMTVEDITSQNLQHRTTTWLEKNFVNPATLSFDADENAAGIKGLTNLKAPTTAIDNMTSLPSVWTRRHYGFVYSGLYDQYDQQGYAVNSGDQYHAGLGCKHGEYGIYKTINKTGISTRGICNGYTFAWYLADELEDRTYYLESQKKNGYFLYVDASEEARPICSKGFEADLCVGSTIIFSAAVANMTEGSSHTAPQLMFKLYGATIDDATGEYTRGDIIHSFASCDFSTVDATSMAKWYQVYAKIVLQQNTGVEKYSNYIVEVDNYAKDTEGADFAIDDIRFYTSTPKVRITQKSPLCGDAEESTGKLTCKIAHESMITQFGTKTDWTSKKVRYRVCKKDNSVIKGVYGGSEEDEYGELTFYRTIPTNDDHYQTINGENYFVLMDNVELPEGVYYVSLSLEAGTDEENKTLFTDWGVPNDNTKKCSVYSNYLTIGQQSITITSGKNNTDTKVSVDCGGSTEATLNATLVLPDPVNGGDYNVSNVSFDWFIGSKSEYGEASYNKIKLSEALSAMRGVESYATGRYTSAPSASGSYTDAYKAVIDYFINNKKLYLGYSLITRSISASEGASGKLHLFMIPLVTIVEINGVKVDVCTDGTEASIETESNGPQLALGFPDVVYPEGNRSLRVGLCQLDEMEKENGKTLVVPVNSFANSDGTTEKFNLDIYESNNVLKMVDTNDPTWTVGTGITIGTVSDLQQTTVNFHFDKTKYSSNVFHEGYWYDLKFEFYDKSALKDGETPCYGSVTIRMKIVPEFVTWTGDNTSNYSNWNNDENWTRSKTEELYKGTSYTNYGLNGTQGDFSSLTQQNSFVPMKFTKVTIPTKDNYQYANLNAMEYDETTGILKSDNLSNGVSHKATDDIEYDIMVKEVPSATVSPEQYTCEKFYGNTCDQVYFKPSAELRYQQHLTYNKAWVEKEMEPKKWYMITVPLCDIWAGDMYLPIQDGRQETEAFKDITFDTNTYNRAKYSVYQRSWDKGDAMQVRPNVESYKADIDYGTSWGETTDVVTNNWSHVYNKLDEQYSGTGFVLNGFALKAGDDDVTSTKSALFRLPKADEQYNYYKYDGTTVDGNAVATSKSNSGKLIYDKDYSTDAVTQTLTNSSKDNTLYIVSNPYMASLDMQKFFAENTGLSPSYWTIIGDDVKGEPVNTDDNSTVYPSIAPLQSFLVSKASSSNITSVTFTTAMITSGKPIAFTTDVKASAPQQKVRTGVVNVPSPTLWITASNEFGSSNARVVENSNADEGFVDSEDLKMIYDSNIADLPFVYTVAGDEAVSVNKLPSLELLPIGIVSDNSSNVSIKVSGLESFKNTLYLLDAKDATVIPLVSDGSLTIVPNEHGRYYLTTRSNVTLIENVEANSAIKAYSPAIHTLVVSALGSTINSIKVFTTDGKIVAKENVNSETATLTTISGVNVVMVETKVGTKTIKVNVR